jgi:hypothetical protein
MISLEKQTKSDTDYVMSKEVGGRKVGKKGRGDNLVVRIKKKQSPLFVTVTFIL